MSPENEMRLMKLKMENFISKTQAGYKKELMSLKAEIKEMRSLLSSVSRTARRSHSLSKINYERFKELVYEYETQDLDNRFKELERADAMTMYTLKDVQGSLEMCYDRLDKDIMMALTIVFTQLEKIMGEQDERNVD